MGLGPWKMPGKRGPRCCCWRWGEWAATQDSQMFLICANWGTKQVLVKTHLQAFQAELFNFYSKKMVPGSGSQERRGGTAASPAFHRPYLFSYSGLRDLKTTCFLRLVKQPLPSFSVCSMLISIDLASFTSGSESFRFELLGF